MVKGSALTHDGAHAISSPVGGQTLDFDIPWNSLDAYSEARGEERADLRFDGDPLFEISAPEWNWWHMLKHLDLKFVCEYFHRATQAAPASTNRRLMADYLDANI